MKQLAFAALLVLAFAASAVAGSGDGVDAYARGEYATAFKQFRALAERGNAKAQHNLGVMYAEGQGVPRDYAEAMKWYRLAAEQGVARAQSNLGAMY